MPVIFQPTYAPHSNSGFSAECSNTPAAFAASCGPWCDGEGNEEFLLTYSTPIGLLGSVLALWLLQL